MEAWGPDTSPGPHEGHWLTPAGNPATLFYRGDTTDWNTVSAIMRNPMASGGETGNEYHIPTGLSGWALDVGAHIGSATIALLIDNPALRVLAIEAVPPNAALIHQNLAANGLTDRAIVWNSAAWSKSGTMQVEYGYTGSEIAESHRFIGSVSPWLSDAPRAYVDVKSVTLTEALKVTDGAGFVWVKTDCEGCEHPFFKGPGLKKLGIIEGEWHERDGTPESFAERLSKTHDVSWVKGIGGGPFRAVPR